MSDIKKLEERLHNLEQKIKDLEKSQKVKKDKKPRKPSDYNIFIGEKMKELKKKDPDMKHSEALKKAAKLWREKKEGK